LGKFYLYVIIKREIGVNTSWKAERVNIITEQVKGGAMFFREFSFGVDDDAYVVSAV